MFMSKEYYTKIKSVRGGGESGINDKYNINYFLKNDIIYNNIVDEELYNKKYDFKELIPHFSPNDRIMYYKYLDKSKYYFEFGSGGSTYQASIRNNIYSIICVESDIEWLNKLKEIVNNTPKINFKYCNMNTLPNTWGNPGPNSTEKDWIEYSDVITKIDERLLSNLDLVLIDGRFRVACCLKCYNHINNNCIIIFDDFLDRPYYHVVLEYFDIIEQTTDNKMVVLKKKIGKNIPKELIAKYEIIKS